MAVVSGTTLTPAARLALLSADRLMVDAGCWLLDSDDVFIEDISADFVADGSEVIYGLDRSLHRSCRLRIGRTLMWGSQRLQPFILLSTDGDTWYKWNLGVFVPSFPERVAGETPVVFDVDGFDKLDILNTIHGSTYTVALGDAIIDAVEALIAGAGESKVQIDQTANTTVAASDRVFSIADNWTTLAICNDLLTSIGYETLWTDRDGNYRARPYRTPDLRPVVFTYDANDASTTIVGEFRSTSSDLYQAANQVIGVRDDPADDIPVTDDGIYTLTNQSDGPTSVDARGGRIIRRVVRGEYADQAALVTAVTKALDAEKRGTEQVRMTVSPNPIHSHYDVVTLTDSALNANGRYLITDWTLPLDGGDMDLMLRAT